MTTPTPPPPPDLVPIRRALISVSDKSGIELFAKALAARGIEIISTGGTAALLTAAGLKVTPVEEITGFPEMMDGRIKTLHPKVHGALLALRDNPAHQRAMAEHGITPIDLVVVNLYPFESAASRPGATLDDAIENIDIGGPSMIRSAAKNFGHVCVVTHAADYEKVLEELEKTRGFTSLSLRGRLAARAFRLTARYDAAIAAELRARLRHAGESRFPRLLNLAYSKLEDLRYGENPHQAAAVYTSLDSAPAGPSVVGARKLHGKELSYNNLADASAALELVRALAELPPGPNGPCVGACVVKHTNPCGAAIASTVSDAVDEAFLGDPLAAYGGILAVSAELDGPTAARLCRNDVFLEVVVAPSFSPSALDQLRTRWANLRILATGPLTTPTTDGALRYQFIPGGVLVQEQDRRAARPDEYTHRAGPSPTPETIHLASFLEAVCRALTSNAIAIGGVSPERGTGAWRLFGAGAGQMDRVAACKIAVRKARKLALGATAFSDAFFPFPDGPKLLVRAGISCIVHPGGSKRDQDTFDLCQEKGVTCLTTGLRHFRH